MQYLTDPGEIKYVISELASTKVLWVDTEIADWYTQNPRLSLIQVLADPRDITGVSAYILDVLDQDDLATEFINKIMVNSSIEKVFHNASFDLRYLGGELATNITCTLKIARKITRERLQVSNLKLKTLASQLCHFVNVDGESGASDWGIRPLSQKQLQYAAMDTVYLAAVHRSLLDMENNISEPVKERPSHPSLNPTKVRIAFECPRLFYLNHKFGDSAIFLPPDTPRGIGNHFHQLADEFIKLALMKPEFKTLFQAEAENLNIEEVSSQMQGIFYKFIFYPYLERVSQNSPDTVVILLKVWEGLQGLIKRFVQLLITNRSYCDAESLISETFISGESSLEHYFTLPDGTQQRVRGEFDCLVFNLAQKRLCVVEFKTYQPVDPSAQLAQVSLYSYMLWQTKKVAVDASVYCVLPEFKEYQYSWEQLESTIHQLIPYKLLQMQQWLSWEPPQPHGPPVTPQVHLCEICPQQQKCGTFFTVVPENRDNQVTQDHTGENREEDTHRSNNRGESVNADAIGEDLVNALQSFKVPVEYQGAAIGPAFIRVKLKPDLGVKVNAIMKLSADLQVHLGLERPPLIAPQAGYISVDLPRPQRQVARFETYIQQESLPPTAPLKIAMGVNIDGELIEADLSDANTCHFLVGGTTGSGKSEFLRSLLLSLLYHHSPQHLKIALVDPKRVTFPEFEQIPWLYSPVVKDSDRAVELMEELVTEMESRYRKLENARCPDLITYNQNSPQPLPRIVCIFDEYADFMAEKAVRKVLELSIKRLGAMARAAGIHLIIATQRPEAGIVTPIIRSNLPGRIALRTASEADSKIVLGGTETSAAYLLGKGDLLYQIGAQMQRLQGLYAQKINIPRFAAVK